MGMFRTKAETLLLVFLLLIKSSEEREAFVSSTKMGMTSSPI
jgi:hypothetical protein